MEQDQKPLPSEMRRLFALLRISRRPGLQSLASSYFRKVPPEILEMIVSHLPMASAAILSLCCQPLAAALGSRYLKEVIASRGGTQSKNAYDYMTLLGRDIPHLTECYKCMSFHNRDEVQQHIPSNWHYLYSPPCWNGSGEHWDFQFGWDHRERYLLHYNFSIPIFQTTMRHYRQGLNCGNLLQSLTLPTTTSSRTRVSKRIMQHSSRPQIVDGSLILRTKVAFLEPSPDFDFSFFIICPHSGILNSNFSNFGGAVRFRTILSETIRYHRQKLPGRRKKARRMRAAPGTPQNREVDPQFAPGKLHQCNYCATEFRIDFKAFKGYGSAMFITKWQDLGDGEDGKWESQLVGLEGPKDTPMSFEAGSICEAFEANRAEEEKKELHDEWYLTCKDKEELLKKQREVKHWKEPLSNTGWSNG